MKEKDIIPFLGRRVEVIMKSGRRFVGNLSSVSQAEETFSGEAEINLEADEGFELGATFDEIRAIRVLRED